MLLHPSAHLVESPIGSIRIAGSVRIAAAPAPLQCRPFDPADAVDAAHRRNTDTVRPASDPVDPAGCRCEAVAVGARRIL